MTDRAAYITGLRRLADLLDQHPDMPLPYGDIQWQPNDRNEFAILARLLPGPHRKDASDAIFTLSGRVSGVTWRAYRWRDEVCERVVVDTREVTKTVPDPAVDVPTVEITETQEVVEWRCPPLLAGADQ